MFNPDSKEYPLNDAGEPEFSTVILTVDGVCNNPELGDTVVQKIVLSTDDLITALSANAQYFGEPGLLANPTNGNLLVQSGRLLNPVFAYITPREGTMQIITSTPTWDFLVQHASFGRTSTLLTSEKLQEVVAHQLANLKEFTGGFPNLLLLDFSSIDEDEGADAASLRDTALVEEV